MAPNQPPYSRNAPIRGLAGPTEPPSSPPWPAATESSSDAIQVEGADALDVRQSPGLGGTLGGRDTRRWVPTSESEAQAAIEEVQGWCEAHCPQRRSCAKEVCNLWNLETRAIEFLDASTGAENVGVAPQEVIGL